MGLSPQFFVLFVFAPRLPVGVKMLLTLLHGGLPLVFPRLFLYNSIFFSSYQRLSVVRDLLSVVFLDSSTTNLVDFCQNAQTHFAPQKSLTLEAWNASLPTEEEKQQMRTVGRAARREEDRLQLLLRLYYMPTFEGKAFFLDEYPALAPWISISQIQDYVVIHEKFPPSGGLFPRNWGLVALCEPRTCSRFQLSRTLREYLQDSPSFGGTFRL